MKKNIINKIIKTIKSVISNKSTKVNGKDLSKHPDTAEFVSSCASGDLEKVTQFVKEGLNPNCKSEDNMPNTPLSSAVDGGHLTIVKYLVSNGALINEPVESHETSVFSLAAQQNQLEIVKLFLEKGVELNDFEDALMSVIYIGHYDMFKILLSDLKFKPKPLYLFLAVDRDHLDIAMYLYEKHKVDVNNFYSPNEYGDSYIETLNTGSSMLITAISRCKYFAEKAHPVYKWLLEIGADVNYKSRHDKTPLMEAAYCGLEEIAQELIDRGANINESTDWTTALHCSLMEFSSLNIDCVKLLLENGADPEVSVSNPHGFNLTPLECAVQSKRKDLIKLLESYIK